VGETLLLTQRRKDTKAQGILYFFASWHLSVFALKSVKRFVKHAEFWLFL